MTSALLLLALALSPETSARYQQALADMQARNYGAAIEKLNALAKDNPKVAEIFASRCSALISNAQYAAAEADCAYAVGLKPNLPEAIYALAVAEDHQGKAKQAVEHYRKYAAFDGAPLNDSALARADALARTDAFIRASAAPASAPAATAAPPVEMRLDHKSAAPACPDAAALQRAVAERLGRDPFTNEARQTLVVRVSGKARAFRAELKVIDETGAAKGQKTLQSRASDCSELASSVALAMALIIDPLLVTRPPPAAPPPVAQAPVAQPPAAQAQPAAPGGAWGRLVIYRNHSMAGMAPMRIIIDGHVLGDLAYGQSVEIEAAPGAHMLESRSTPRDVFDVTQVWTHPINLGTGTTYVNFDTSFGQIMMQEVPGTTARREVLEETKKGWVLRGPFDNLPLAGPVPVAQAPAIVVVPGRAGVVVPSGGNGNSYCNSSIDCGPGGWCKDRGDGVNVCMSHGGRGASCQSSIDCSGGLWCKDRGDGMNVCM